MLVHELVSVWVLVCRCSHGLGQDGRRGRARGWPCGPMAVVEALVWRRPAVWLLVHMQ